MGLRSIEPGSCKFFFADMPVEIYWGMHLATEVLSMRNITQYDSNKFSQSTRLYLPIFHCSWSKAPKSPREDRPIHHSWARFDHDSCYDSPIHQWSVWFQLIRSEWVVRSQYLFPHEEAYQQRQIANSMVLSKPYGVQQNWPLRFLQLLLRPYGHFCVLLQRLWQTRTTNSPTSTQDLLTRLLLKAPSAPDLDLLLDRYQQENGKTNLIRSNVYLPPVYIPTGQRLMVATNSMTWATRMMSIFIRE